MALHLPTASCKLAYLFCSSRQPHVGQCELQRLHTKDPGSFLKAGAAQTSLKRFMSCQSQCLPPGHLTCSCFKARVNLWLLSAMLLRPGGATWRVLARLPLRVRRISRATYEELHHRSIQNPEGSDHLFHDCFDQASGAKLRPRSLGCRSGITCWTSRNRLSTVGFQVRVSGDCLISSKAAGSTCATTQWTDM